VAAGPAEPGAVARMKPSSAATIAAASTRPEPDPWRRAALLEGVSREDQGDPGHPWINT